MRHLFILLALSLLVLPTAASAHDVAIATWNLGWHMDRSGIPAWIDACNETYEVDPLSKKFVPSK